MTCSDFFSEVDDIAAEPELGRAGAGIDGWSFTLWGAIDADEGVHRMLLLQIDKEMGVSLSLPAYKPYEDYVFGALTWNSTTLKCYYETVLHFLSFWSSDRTVLANFRSSVLKLIENQRDNA